MDFDIQSIKRKMLVKYPLFGSIVANVKYKEDMNISTAGTDGQTIFYNPRFLRTLEPDEQTFIFAHEVCHIAFDHINRSEGKDIHTWNIATDGVINQLLKRDGLKIVEGGVDIEEAINYDAEGLYDKLMQEKQANNSDTSSNEEVNNDKEMNNNQSDSPSNNQGTSSNANTSSNEEETNDKEMNNNQSNQSNNQETSSNANTSSNKEETNDEEMNNNQNNQSNNSETSSSEETSSNEEENNDEEKNNNQSDSQSNNSGTSSNANTSSNEEENNDEEMNNNQSDSQSNNSGTSSNANTSSNEEETNDNEINNNQSNQSNNSETSSSEDTSSNEEENNDNEMNNNQSDNQSNNSDSSSSEDGLSNKEENESKKQEKDVGHDTHSMWKDAIKRRKEKNNQEEKKWEQEDKDSDKISERNIFEQNSEEKRKELEKLKEILSRQAVAGSGSSQNDLKVHDIGKSRSLLDWRYVLREAINYDVDWSYKNAYIEDGVICANLEEQPMPETEIVLDTSGSIDILLLKNFLRECKNILQNSKIKVGCFDDEFYGFQEIRRQEDIDNMKFVGGGGTNFEVAVQAFTRRVENKIIFTDGEAGMPETSLDAIWIVFGGLEIDPPGGRVIQINDEQLEKLYGYSNPLEKRIFDDNIPNAFKKYRDFMKGQTRIRKF